MLARYGDVFGPVVNIASRLTGLARPGTVLIDQELSRHCAATTPSRCSGIRTTSVRGYQHLTPYRLRRRLDVGEDSVRTGRSIAPAAAARRENSTMPSTWRAPSEKSSVRK